MTGCNWLGGDWSRNAYPWRSLKRRERHAKKSHRTCHQTLRKSIFISITSLVSSAVQTPPKDYPRCFPSSARTCRAQRPAPSPPPPPAHWQRCRLSAAWLILPNSSTLRPESKLCDMRSVLAQVLEMSRATEAQAGSESQASCRRVLNGTCC